MLNQAMCRTWAKAGSGALERGRAERVIMLIAIAAAAGLADLALTLHHMASGGMVEANPLARLLVQLGPLWLVLFKCATIGLHGGVLWLLRHRRAAEIGAWFSFAVFVALAVQWWSYTAALESADGACLRSLYEADPRWIRIDI